MDMFRFEIARIQTNGDKQHRNVRLDSEKRTGLEMEIYLGSIRLKTALKAGEWTR